MRHARSLVHSSLPHNHCQPNSCSEWEERKRKGGRGGRERGAGIISFDFFLPLLEVSGVASFRGWVWAAKHWGVSCLPEEPWKVRWGARLRGLWAWTRLWPPTSWAPTPPLP